MKSLIERLKKCGCMNIQFCSEHPEHEHNGWYKLQLIYNKRYYRFFALSFDELEQQSLSKMRKLSREYNVRIMTRGEVKCLVW